MVVTILVVAFGFLVYRKMDLHQRSLTQAAIESPDAPDASTANSPSASDGTATTVNSAAVTSEIDPQLNMADLSDGSPFGSDATPLESQSQTQSLTDVNDGVPFSFDEPQPDLQAAADSSADHSSASEMTFDAIEPATEPTSVASAFDSEQLGSNTATAGSAAATGPAVAIDPSSTRHSDNELASARSANADIGSLAQSIDSIPDLDTLATDAQTSPATQPAGVDDSTPALDTTSEPVLLAMTDAEAHTDSAANFDALRSAPSSAASSSSAQSDQQFAFTDDQIENRPGFDGTVRDVTETFPDLTNSEPEATDDVLLAAQEPTPFGSGFDAVTQPSERSRRSGIQTAAGSGADGKFSLAAFNYQNNTAEPAPDDGSLFDSVIVQDGDNYTRIAKRVYGSSRYFSALAVFNQHRIPDPSRMRPGMVVLTPAKEVLEERYPQLFEGSKPRVPEPAMFLLLDDGSPACRVGERETLSDLSQRYLGRASRWIEIYRLNQTLVNDPNKLKPGIILALPADATEVNVAP